MEPSEVTPRMPGEDVDAHSMCYYAATYLTEARHYASRGDQDNVEILIALAEAHTRVANLMFKIEERAEERVEGPAF